MADLKISELTNATALGGTERLPVVQGGQTRGATASQIVAVQHPHTLADISNAGTAAALDVPATPGASASSSQVVRGDDPRLGAAGIYTDRGNVSGAVIVDMNNERDVVQRLRLTGSTTITIQNAPASTFAALTLVIVQDGTGGRTLALPGNVTILNGGDGSIDPAASATTVITLFTINGGSNYFVSASDARVNRYDPIIINPTSNGSYYFTWHYPIVVDLALVVARGTGSVAYARSTGGAFSGVSGAVSLAAGDTFRATISGLGSWYTLAIPRIA